MSFPYKVVRHEKSHESAEDYLENILILRERNGNVRSIDIVNEMNYSKRFVILNRMKDVQKPLLPCIICGIIR